MKRVYLNIALLVIVTGLAATIWFTQKKAPPKGPPLTTLSADAVTSIRIEHPNEPTITLEKKGAEWQLTEPVQSPTDPFEVASLVNLATTEIKHALKVSDVKLADLKLDPPQFTITLNDQKLEFGDTEPLEYRRYVRHGDSIALIDDPSGTAVDADYSNLAAKELISPGVDIDKIEVPGLSVSRSEGKDWRATPASAAATGDALAKFVQAWRAARSMWNTAMPADGGKGEPITLTLKDGVVHLVLVSTEPQLIIDRPDLKLRYTLSKADVATLLKLDEPAPVEPSKPAAAANPAHP